MQKDKWQERGQGHRARLRDKFLTTGLAGFTDADIIEVLLSFGTPRSDCKQQAKELLAKLGTFSKVLEAPIPVLAQVDGVGPKNCFALHFVQAVASHYLKERIQGKQYLHSSKEVADYLLHAMRGLKKEVFTAIFLDSSHAIIKSEIVAQGTININTIYPREIITKALDCNAAALVVAHNHPSGELRPSSQDIQLTKTLFLLCSLMQLQLLDHIIIGNGTYSFADNGQITEIRIQCQTTLAHLGQSK